ncbi:hypothetical protein F6V25_14345 [Oryzomonas japonica]|uniref:Uncharacterized protein n=1 Tax=Oryzomonas japonica TaxID=2603858 RepID=A0A7J4ZMY1_9BACT|nr:hypothetical protein [Oryzomonas japonica]KAB0663991.1 hypothetical protein F6V25_14345 [Oryzomonas japonica]
MRKLLAAAAAVALLQAAPAAWAGISFNINVGGPPVVIAQPPDFLYPAELGFGVAVGVPYDMFYLSGVYFINRGGGWYRTSYYGGDWVRVRYRELPPELRRYKMGRIHEYRDREYRVYSRDRDHYRGRYYRPDRDGRDGRRDMGQPGREQRREMKEERRDQRRDVKEERREQRRDAKEERRDQKEERRDQKDERRDERGGR